MYFLIFIVFETESNNLNKVLRRAKKIALSYFELIYHIYFNATSKNSFILCKLKQSSMQKTVNTGEICMRSALMQLHSIFTLSLSK